MTGMHNISFVFLYGSGAAIVLAGNVHSGGPYEQKTIGALAFRTLLTGAFYFAAARLGNTAHSPNQHHTP